MKIRTLNVIMTDVFYISSYAKKKQNQASFLNRPAYKQPIHKQDMLSGMAEKSQNGLSLPYIYHYDQIKHNESYFS